jgi:hypothetical protein
MKNNTIPTTDLAEARSSLTRLLPHLPWPKLTEKMNYCGLLPNVGGEVAALPIVTQPEALMMEIGPWIFRKLPEQWKPAYYFHRRRLFRNAQVLRLHPACQAAGDDVLADLDETTDGVVAGMLLLSLRPLPGQLRTALLDHCHQDGWGTYFAALGTVYAHETAGLLSPIANDPRLAAGLYRENADLAAPLTSQALRQNDVWSATIALPQAAAAQWLDRVVSLGRTHPVAAVTALTLLPAMSPDLRRVHAWNACAMEIPVWHISPPAGPGTPGPRTSGGHCATHCGPRPPGTAAKTGFTGFATWNPGALTRP